MATVKVIDNVLEAKWNTYNAAAGTSVENLIRELDSSVYEETYTECYDCETGLTTYEPISDSSDTTSVIINVNGKPVPIDYIVQELDVIEIIFTPASGDNWSWTGAVLGGITGFVTGAIRGSSFGPYGWIVGGIVGGVIGFVLGGLVGGALNDDSSGSSDKLDTESLPDIRGSQNQLITDNPFPAVFGRHLVTPFIVGSTYNDIYGSRGQTCYINALYLVGYAPLRITDLKLGEQFLAHNQSWGGNESMQNVFHGLLQGTSSDGEKDSGDIVNIWHANNISVEILQQGQNGEEIDWGMIYPYATLQEDIKANVLYIADGSTDDEPLVNYKSTMLANGLRNNPVKFTRQSPLSTKIELNFPNGLYRTRTKDGNISYEKIPLWVAMQWRVYSDDNNSISGDKSGVISGDMTPESKNYWWDSVNGRAATTKRGWHTFKTANGKSRAWSISRVIDNSSVSVNKTETFIKHYPASMYVECGTIYTEDGDYYNEAVSGTYNMNAEYTISVDEAFAKTTYVKFSVVDTVNYACRRKNRNYYIECDIENVHYDDEYYTNTLKFKRTLTGVFQPGETTCTVIDAYSESFEFLFDSYGQTSKDKATLSLSCTDFQYEYDVLSPEFFKSSDVLTVNGTTIISKDENTDVSQKGIQVSVFLYSDRQRDKDKHSGNTFPKEINDDWIGAELFNFESLGGTASDKAGLSEFRVVTSVNFEDWARENFTYSSEAEFIKMFKEYFMPAVNSTQSIEVRVVRISPNYLDETSSSGDTGPYTYQDVFTWQTLTTTKFDKEHFIKHCENETDINNNNVIVPVRPLSETDMRKFCLIAVRAKTDNTDQIGNTLKKFTCMAQSFAPYYDSEQRKWFPESVNKITKYYEPNIVNPDKTVTQGDEITEQEFIEERQNGVKALRVKAGNDFVKNLVTNVIRTSSNKDGCDRYIIPDDLDSTYAQAGLDPKKYIENNVASIILLSGLGAHVGINALDYSDYDMASLAKVFEFEKEVTDGSTYNSDGYHYNKDGIQVYHKGGEVCKMYFTANTYLYNTDKLESVLKKICIAGRCVYTRTRNNKLTFIIDKPEKYHVALINQSNTLSSSYTLNYQDLPAGLLIPFKDEEDGFEANSLYCMKDGEEIDNYRGVIEEYQLDFVTNPYQAWSLGRYILANRILNREVITKKIGMEGYSIGLGNIVCVQDDTMLIGTDNGGRITQVLEDDDYIYGFVINNTYEFTGELDNDNLVKKGVVVMQPSQWDESRVITLRLAPLGTVCPVEVNGKSFTVKKGHTNIVVLATRISKNGILTDGSEHYVINPQVDNIVGFGEIGKENSLYRVVRITSDEKHNYEFTLLKYQEELYNYGKALPSFQNNVTKPNSDADNINISTSVTDADLKKTATQTQNAAQAYTDTMMGDIQEKVDNLADNPVIYTSISSCGVAVNDDDITVKEQNISITFYARQGESDLDFYFPIDTIRQSLPSGYSVVIDSEHGNPHTLILTIAEGTLVTTESLTFPIMFTAYKYDFNYADEDDYGYYDGSDGEYGVRTEQTFETEYKCGFTIIGVQGGRYLNAVAGVTSDYIYQASEADQLSGFVVNDNLYFDADKNLIASGDVGFTDSGLTLSPLVWGEDDEYQVVFIDGKLRVIYYGEEDNALYELNVNMATGEITKGNFIELEPAGYIDVTSLSYGALALKKTAVNTLILGDYFVYQGNDTQSTLAKEGYFYKSQLYQFDGISSSRTYMWEKDSMSEHCGGSLTDALKVANESLSHNNSNITQFLDHLTANSIFVDKLVARKAFIDKLAASTIKLQTDSQGNAGVIYGGDRYNADGTDNDTDATGFYLDTNGNLKAKDATFENMQATGGTFRNVKVMGAFANVTSGLFMTWSTGGTQTLADAISSWFEKLMTNNIFTNARYTVNFFAKIIYHNDILIKIWGYNARISTPVNPDPRYGEVYLENCIASYNNNFGSATVRITNVANYASVYAQLITSSGSYTFDTDLVAVTPPYDIQFQLFI